MSDTPDPDKEKKLPAEADKPKAEAEATKPKPRSPAAKPQFKVTQSPFAPNLGGTADKKTSASAPAKPKPAPAAPLTTGTSEGDLAEPAEVQAVKKPVLDRPAAASRPPRKSTSAMSPGAIDALERESSTPQMAALAGVLVDVAAAAVAVGFTVMLLLEVMPFL